MKLKTTTLLPAVVALLRVTSAAVLDSEILQLQASLPACSVACLAQGAQEFDCGLTDLYCQCTQLETIKAVVAPCLINEGGCELEEVTDTVEVVAQMCVSYFETNNLTLPDADSRSTTTNTGPDEDAAATLAGSRLLGIAATVGLTAMLFL